MSKKLFLFIAILLIGGLAGTGLVLAGGTDLLGQGGYPSDPHRISRFVHNPNATTIPAGFLVIWDLTADNGVSVAVTTLSGDSAVAGILITALSSQETAANTAAKDIGRRNWAFLQTYGLYSTAINDASYAAVAGAALGASGTAGRVCRFGSTPHALSTQRGRAGFFYDAAATSGTNVEVFLNIN